MTQRRNYAEGAHGTSYADSLGWRDRAACASANPAEQAAMTDGTGHTGLRAAREAARKFCDDCPVRTECFNWAQGERLFMGVAAGMLFGFQSGKHYRPDYRRLVEL